MPARFLHLIFLLRYRLPAAVAGVLCCMSVSAQQGNSPATTLAPCQSNVNTFPYDEGFEASQGAWFTGGQNSDWAWGSPSKTVISVAGQGAKCWVTGGLTGRSYKNSESSWLQSPCFNFSTLVNPVISFQVLWESELKYDGATFEYSTDGGSTWSILGSASGNTCPNINWFNYSSIKFVGDRPGWSGNIQSTSGNCLGGGGSGTWVLASHELQALAGKPSVSFRFSFGSGSTCNAFEGFAIDAIHIGEAAPNNADFSYNCGTGRSVSFNRLATCATSTLWNFGDVASGAANGSTSATPSHTFSAAGTYNVSLTVSFATGLPVVQQKTISILEANIAVNNTIKCFGDATGAASVSAIGAASNQYTYSWNTSPPQSTPAVTGLTAGNYVVNVSSANSCGISKSVILSEPAKLQVSITISPALCTANNGQISTTVIGGTVPYTYTWSNGQSTSFITNLATGNYSLTVRDGNGCNLTTPTLVVQRQNAVINPGIVISPAICTANNGQITTNAGGGTAPYKYTWSTGASTANINLLPAGTYGLTINDANGCSFTTSTLVVQGQNDLINAGIVISPAICTANNGQVTTNASGGTAPYKYTWTTGAQTASINALPAGNFGLMIDDANGCTYSSTSITVPQRNDVISISLGRDVNICPGDKLVLSPGAFTTYTWQDGTTLASYTVVQSGTYSVVVTNENGCTGTASVTVTVDCSDVFFPSGFTPNGDGLNDLFGPRGNVGALTKYTLQVYNRYGQRIFSTTDPYKKWDGRYKGSYFNTGSFVWLASYTLNGNAYTKKGTLTLLK